MAMMQISATDGTGAFNAYLATPKNVPAGAVVLIQEIFGVNQSLRDTADSVADLGFFVIAPDLFWRQEPGVDITDKTEAEWQKAFALMNGFNQDKGVEDLKATLAAARALPGCNGKAGTMGYCLGGRLAFLMATRSDADINISYYGVGLDGLLGELPAVRAPLLLHIAELDTYVPPPARDQIVDATADNKLIATHVYANADHAFARVNGVHWHGLSAAIANGRSAEALAAALT